MQTTRKYKILQIFTLILALLCGLAGTNVTAQNSATITVAAAADLQPVLQPIAEAFRRETGAQLQFVFGSSGNLEAQIENGAPFDLFLSADRAHVDAVVAAGKGVRGAERVYAIGKLVAWTPPSIHLDFPHRGLPALLDPQVKAIAIANPAHAPYGKAAIAALQHDGIYDAVKSKLVLGENVAQAAQFASTGNAQVALIAIALARNPRLQGNYWELPASAYPPLEQVMVPLTAGAHPDLARKFAEFMIGAEAQKVLAGFGFSLPGASAATEAPR